MAGEENYSPYLIVGKLSRDFILTREGNDINDLPGGHLLYSAIGMAPWEKNPGLVARIGSDFPHRFIENLSKYNFSTDGLKYLGEPLEHRNFISFYEPQPGFFPEKAGRKSVLSQYFHAGKVFPRELLGYTGRQTHFDSGTERSKETILVRDIPRSFLEARCILLCPLDYLSHNLLPQAFSGAVRPTIVVHAGSAYMQPFFFDAVKPLIAGLSAFITRERNLRSLFSEKFRFNDTDEMMKVLLGYGAENIVVAMEDETYRFINRIDGKVRRLDPGDNGQRDVIGRLSCFCGAYLIGLNETYDPVKAAAYGAARASLLRNELNPFNNLNVLQRLLDEKIELMANRVEAGV